MTQRHHAAADPQENAMTEIALALAMGFFSIMVLTMISMGAGTGTGKAAAPRLPEMLAVQPATTAAAEKSPTAAPTPKDLILVFYDGRYLDTSLHPVDPAAALRAAGDPDRRVVLALDPALSVAQAMKAREGVPASNIVVSSLDARWLRALAATKGGRR